MDVKSFATALSFTLQSHTINASEALGKGKKLYSTVLLAAILIKWGSLNFDSYSRSIRGQFMWLGKHGKCQLHSHIQMLFCNCSSQQSPHPWAQQIRISTVLQHPLSTSLPHFSHMKWFACHAITIPQIMFTLSRDYSFENIFDHYHEKLSLPCTAYMGYSVWPEEQSSTPGEKQEQIPSECSEQPFKLHFSLKSQQLLAVWYNGSAAMSG